MGARLRGIYRKLGFPDSAGFVDDPDDTKDGFYFYNVNSSSWERVGSASSLWSLNNNGVYRQGHVIIGSDGNYADPLRTAKHLDAALDVHGDIVVGGNDQQNMIWFRGVARDDQADLQKHTVICERKYDNPESSELIIFKGDNGGIPNDQNGPDRIKLDATGGIQMCVGGVSNRWFESPNQGDLAMSILPNTAIQIGHNTSLNHFQATFPPLDQGGNPNGTLVLKGSSIDGGSTSKRRVLVIGNDGNEINATNTSGNPSESVLFLNYDNKNDVSIGTWLSTVNNNRSDLYVDGEICSASFGCLSDRRLKENISPLKSSLKKVLSLEAVSFSWKKEKNNPATHFGFIAQDVQKVIPELVNEMQPVNSKEPEEESRLSVNYTGFIPLLTEAIKEQQAQIESLKKGTPSNGEDLFQKVATQRKEIANLREQMISQQRLLEQMAKRLQKLEKKSRRR